MLTSYPLRSTLKQNKKSTFLSKISVSTKKSAPNRPPKVSHRKDASIGTHEAFCDMYFDVPPGKPIKEVRKVF